MESKREIPTDINAEEAVLGSLLIDPDVYWEMADTRADAFYREKNRWVYEAILSLVSKREGINQITVAHELADQGKLEAIGGPAYLSHLISVVPTTVHIEHYAGIVKKTAFQRSLIREASRIAAIGYKGEDPEVALSQAIGGLLKLAEGQGDRDIITPKMFAEDALKRFTWLANKEPTGILSFGLSKLDNMGVIQNGESIILSGETGVGKTTLLSQFARWLEKIAPVLICSCEMSEDQLLDREMAHLTGVFIKTIARGNYPDALKDSVLGEGTGQLSETNIYYAIAGKLTPMQIQILGRKMQARYGLGVVIVDHLQALKDDERGGNLYAITTNIANGLKAAAIDLNVPVITSCILSQGLFKDVLRRLKNSGDIGYIADWVMEFQRDIEKSPSKATLFVAKNRQGDVGKVNLRYVWQRQEYIEEKEGD